MEAEDQLCHLLKDKPEEGIALALDWYGGAVKTICRQILFDCTSEDQEEAIADTFLRLWQSVERFQEGKSGSLKSYLYGIARHTVYLYPALLLLRDHGTNCEETQSYQ